MNAYVCVYRQPTMEMIRDDGWEQTWKEVNSKSSPRRRRLKKYLQTYEDAFFGDEEGRFYDWGDDPSFFCAEELLHNIRKASWAVCRPDIRRSLCEEDFVVFFCTQQQEDDTDLWRYYYIGLGTVGKVVRNHKRIWKDRKYKEYRRFENLLINSRGDNKEIIRPRHDDKGKNYRYRWQDLEKDPYIIFDDSKCKTHFNIKNPLLVAEYRVGDSPWRGEVLENWQIGNEKAEEIFALIPKREGGKKLRGSPIKRNAHPHLNMSKLLNHDVKLLEKRKKDLLRISKEIAAQ